MNCVHVSFFWLVTVIHGIMKLRAVATLWLSNPQCRHPVCTALLPWLRWLNTQRDQLYWQGHVPAQWSLRGAWTHTHPHKLTHRYTYKYSMCTPTHSLKHIYTKKYIYTFIYSTKQCCVHVYGFEITFTYTGKICKFSYVPTSTQKGITTYSRCTHVCTFTQPHAGTYGVTVLLLW